MGSLRTKNEVLTHSFRLIGTLKSRKLEKNLRESQLNVSKANKKEGNRRNLLGLPTENEFILLLLPLLSLLPLLLLLRLRLRLLLLLKQQTWPTGGHCFQLKKPDVKRIFGWQLMFLVHQREGGVSFTVRISKPRMANRPQPRPAHGPHQFFFFYWLFIKSQLGLMSGS